MRYELKQLGFLNLWRRLSWSEYGGAIKWEAATKKGTK